MVLPKKNVKAVPNGVQLTFINILPSITIKDFKIENIAEHADVFVGGRLLEEADFRQIQINLDGKDYKLEDFEQIPVIKIPHKPSTKVFFPSDAQKGEKLKFKVCVKKGAQIAIEVEHQLQ